MRRLAMVPLVLFVVACSSKKPDAPAGGSAAPVSAARPDAAPAVTAARDARASTPDAPGRPSDDAVAGFGVGDDGRGLYYDRPLAPADLDGRSLRDLTLMRNVVYARAGHPFRKAWLREYFTA
ncbi:MAG TPA: YARHG domain-containing protein, partial [Kofleriaceae bacterium]|nr:YARHG domain-containing protein [Kofleriaceae bacterium]